MQLAIYITDLFNGLCKQIHKGLIGDIPEGRRKQ